MLKSKRKLKIGLIVALGAVLLALLLWGGIEIALQNCTWGYARTVSHQEEALRQQVISTAETWLGCNEADGSHQPIIDLYRPIQYISHFYCLHFHNSFPPFIA